MVSENAGFRQVCGRGYGLVVGLLSPRYPIMVILVTLKDCLRGILRFFRIIVSHCCVDFGVLGLSQEV